MSKVTIVDYGIGNLLSVQRACEHLGFEVVFTDSARMIDQAERLILPGVGAFADGMRGLMDRKLIAPIQRYAQQDRPFLGICLGMQLMLEIGQEFGEHEGLGIIPGKVIKIPDTGIHGESHKIPHIGWNNLLLPSSNISWNRTILNAVQPGEAVYFVHSFTAVPSYNENRLADCHYNGRVIAAVIRSSKIYGCQFHPEKSGLIGLQIMKNFLAD